MYINLTNRNQNNSFIIWPDSYRYCYVCIDSNTKALLTYFNGQKNYAKKNALFNRWFSFIIVLNQMIDGRSAQFNTISFNNKIGLPNQVISGHDPGDL